MKLTLGQGVSLCSLCGESFWFHELIPIARSLSLVWAGLSDPDLSTPGHREW
ncbi:MAG: hypothetical protein F6J90_08955 [Moorea sp. SIOASIH]|uniref:hypothetical protein n=1 Tax=Moorena TaxID=1155738 RepID=UPI0013BAC29A|nr:MULTISPECIES: hypothetical protein [unclassified Moorena]NEO36444.1 hypothetical protein [Moorena sp. SIOASIH]NEO75621.1 hypothetical protein [Moorena sp. SIO4G3]NEO88838.1 hypothetical protein [Moorena sp. SIO3G5]NEQ58413.1 hypothetical protein [Moorena sp. SIO4A1]